MPFSRIPLVRNIRELHPTPRKFLWFSAFNVMSWQCLVGSALVLFARKIGMEPSLVGVLISFMPLAMVFVLATVPLLARYGAKPVMFFGWMTRNICVCSVFAMPLVMRWGSPEYAGHLLMFATLGFCVMRTVGVGGWFPWLHEVIPPTQRASFFSAEAGLAQFMSIVVSIGQAYILRGDPGIERFLLLYAIGVGAGFVSLYWMSRVPGGRKKMEGCSTSESFHAYLKVLRDHPYLRFMLTTTACASSMSWLGSALIMYMRDARDMTPGMIMLFTGIGAAGVLFTIRAWARFSDHSGSGLAMHKTLGGYASAAMVMAGLTLFDPSPLTTVILTAALTFATICGAAQNMAINRAMLNLVKDQGEVAYTSLWMVFNAIAAGLTPIAVGFVIEHAGVAGYRICFLLSMLGASVCAMVCRHVVPDGPEPPPSLTQMVNPVLPLRTLMRILWISAGMHESNRDETTVPLGLWSGRKTEEQEDDDDDCDSGRPGGGR